MGPGGPIMPQNGKKLFKCHCYNNDPTSIGTQLRSHINSIFCHRNRPQPIQYNWGTLKDEDQAKEWVLKSNDKDLITRKGMSHGFEHNIVVIFQPQDPQKFHIDECMRSTAMLIVVKIPELQLNTACIGKCNS